MDFAAAATEVDYRRARLEQDAQALRRVREARRVRRALPTVVLRQPRRLLQQVVSRRSAPAPHR